MVAVHKLASSKFKVSKMIIFAYIRIATFHYVFTIVRIDTNGVKFHCTLECFFLTKFLKYTYPLSSYMSTYLPTICMPAVRPTSARNSPIFYNKGY